MPNPRNQVHLSIRPTGTRHARGVTTFDRYYCIRSHAHRTEQAAIKCEQAWSRKVQRDYLNANP